MLVHDVFGRLQVGLLDLHIFDVADFIYGLFFGLYNVFSFEHFDDVFVVVFVFFDVDFFVEIFVVRRLVLGKRNVLEKMGDVYNWKLEDAFLDGFELVFVSDLRPRMGKL